VRISKEKQALEVVHHCVNNALIISSSIIGVQYVKSLLLEISHHNKPLMVVNTRNKDLKKKTT